MKQIILATIAVGFSIPAMGAECSGTISYQSGASLSQAAAFYTITGQVVGYSDLNGQFSVSCTANQIFIIRIGSESIKKVLNPGDNQIVINDIPDIDCCQGCTSTDWYSTGNTGYEQRDNASCSSCKCSVVSEYRCGDGWRGITTDGKTGCHQCGGNLRDINGTPIENVEIYNILGALISTSGTNGEFGIECTSGIYVLNINGGVSSKLVMGEISAPDFSGPIFPLSNNIQITLCTSSLEHDKGYYCMGQIQMACPASPDGAPTTSDGKTRTTNHPCYIPAGTTISDYSGTFEFTSNCHYSTN